jgi:peptide/nickel transport system substrate-binding protein
VENGSIRSAVFLSAWIFRFGGLLNEKRLQRRLSRSMRAKAVQAKKLERKIVKAVARNGQEELFTVLASILERLELKLKHRIAKQIVSAMAAAAVLLSLAACSNTTDSPSSASQTGAGEGGTFVYGVQTQPNHLDPYLSSSADTRMILFNIFEGLVKPDADGELKPAVADTISVSADSTSYTFHLRQGVKFQNGDAVTAEDVKYSLDTAAGLSGGEVLVSELENISSVEIADSSTVKIHLKKPDPDFLPYLTTAIVPKGYDKQDTFPIGTGPYSFVSYTPQQSLVLKKNPYYWQEGLPHLDTVTFKLESDSNTLLTDLQGGSVDGASVANNVASQLTGDFDVIATNSNSVQLLALNNKEEPFNKVEVRQAVSYAIDPDAIIETVDFGKGVRSGTPIIPGLKKYSDSSLMHAYDRNVQKAKQLLAQAGLSNGFDMTIIVPSNYTVHVDTAQVIVNQLQEVGIRAKIEQVDFATWLSKAYQNREYQATIISLDGATLSPKSYLSRYVSGNAKNFINYSSSAYDDLYRQATEEKDETKRIELYKKAQQQLSKDAASVFLQDISNINVFRKGFSGYVSYPLYVFDASTIKAAG